MKLERNLTPVPYAKRVEPSVHLCDRRNVNLHETDIRQTWKRYEREKRRQELPDAFEVSSK